MNQPGPYDHLFDLYFGWWTGNMWLGLCFLGLFIWASAVLIRKPPRGEEIVCGLAKAMLFVSCATATMCVNYTYFSISLFNGCEQNAMWFVNGASIMAGFTSQIVVCYLVVLGAYVRFKAVPRISLMVLIGTTAAVLSLVMHFVIRTFLCVARY